jgi:hypothetical protein
MAEPQIRFNDGAAYERSSLSHFQNCPKGGRPRPHAIG